MRRVFRLMSDRSGDLGLGRQNGFQPGDLAADGAQEMGFLKLACLLLQAEVKDLLSEFLLAACKFGGREFTDFVDGHDR
jgi:hypothetical protein